MWRTVMIVQLCSRQIYDIVLNAGCLLANTTETTQIVDLEEKGYLHIGYVLSEQ